MKSGRRFGISSRLVRQPATLILILGSAAALAVGGSCGTTSAPRSMSAGDTASDSAIAQLAAYAASHTIPFPQSRAPAAATEAEPGLPDVATRTARLEARLAREPGDGDGWRLLGLSRAHLGDASGAAAAYARALELRPGDAELVAALENARRTTSPAGQ